MNEMLSNQGDYIPYDLRTRALQVDPVLDVYWQEYLVDLFRTMPQKYQKNVYQQILIPKNIVFNKEAQTFDYKVKNVVGGGCWLPLKTTRATPKCNYSVLA